MAYLKRRDKMFQIFYLDMLQRKVFLYTINNVWSEYLV